MFFTDKFLIIFVLLSTYIFPAWGATLDLDNHPLHYESWQSETLSDKPTVVLLSGPIESWHSDSAWWAWLGPELARSYRVIAFDRAGQVLANPDAPVGYAHFAEDLAQAFSTLQVRDALVVAFASSNISVQLFLAAHPEQQAIKQVVMIDPDVLTDFSIARYKNDAAAFKRNLSAYQDYIRAGKYTARTEQKNAADLSQLQTLSNNAETVDWQYVARLQQARLSIDNQLNLFREIARYDEDLDAVAQTQWPSSMPLVVIDTDFEAAYIDTEQDETQKAGLIAWQQDAVGYYQQLASLHPASRYIASTSREHLYQFAEMASLVTLINQLNK